MAVYYVRHKNPQVPATDYGEKWVMDGPFFSEEDCDNHVARCEYDFRNIEYEIVTEDELATNGRDRRAQGLEDFLESVDFAEGEEE